MQRLPFAASEVIFGEAGVLGPRASQHLGTLAEIEAEAEIEQEKVKCGGKSCQRREGKDRRPSLTSVSRSERRCSLEVWLDQSGNQPESSEISPGELLKRFKNRNVQGP